MTDADWRNGRTRDELLAMVDYIQSRWDARQEWLFGAAVLRRIWDLLTDVRFRELVEAAEDRGCGRQTVGGFEAIRGRLPRIGNWRPPEPSPLLWEPERSVARYFGPNPEVPPPGVLNFRELPVWAQQTHHATVNLGAGNWQAVVVYAADAHANYAAERVPEHGSLADQQDELRRVEARLRREEADAHHRGLTDSANVRASRQRVAEMREQSSWLASQYQAARERTADVTRAVEFAAQADLLRCVAANPFAPVVLEIDWKSETAVSLARGIVADHAFDRLPILADALEEAGCDAPEVLAHCRTPGPHSLGCWVLTWLASVE